MNAETMESVALELIREGAPGGQALSALTRYLALCGNHAPEAFCVTLDHLDFLRKREAWRATREHTAASELAALRGDAVGALARDVTRLLGSLSCLTHEVSAAVSREGGRRTINLRLVLPPLELAALPFELAESTRGLPGVGQPLSLQNEHPVVITRETHRVAPRGVRWPTEPRVLFAWASPPGAGASRVPFERHLLALTHALGPWLSDARDASRWLRVLSNATLDDLREAWAGGRFTHVHILTHGVEREGSTALDRSFALVFDDGSGGAELVDGERLASALAQGGSSGHRPTVVTLASCDGGGVGSVFGGGASVAHHLHAEGVPLVVASQLPLSFEASVIMTEVLYEALLQGRDPRHALHELRRRLRVGGVHPWEWASVVAYAALPDDLSKQLRGVTFQRMFTAVDLRLDRVARGEGGAADRAVIDDFVGRIERAAREAPLRERVEAHDYLGSVALRWIDVRVREALDRGVHATREALADAAPLTSTGIEAAASRAQRHFREVLARRPGAFWAANVVNELGWLLGREYDGATHDVVRWHSDMALSSSDERRRSMGEITALSLDLMEVLLERGVDPAGRARARFDSVVSAGGLVGYKSYRARRVVERFAAWSRYRLAAYECPDALREGGDALERLAQDLVRQADGLQVPRHWPRNTRG